MVKICEHIFLGSYITAQNKTQLDEWKICCVVNVAKNCKNIFSTKYSYICASFEDDSYIKKNAIDEIVDKMHQFIIEKKNVFVHCEMGRSRSVFTIAYYLAKYNKIDKKSISPNVIACYLEKYNITDKNYILPYIHSKKNDIDISPIFVDLLNKYDDINKFGSIADISNICDENLFDAIDKTKKRNIKIKKLFDDTTNNINSQLKIKFEILSLLFLIITSILIYLYFA